MTKYKAFFIPLVLILFIFVRCREDKFDKYQRPDWLAGKVYSQVLDQPDLSTFAKCIELSGYDTIIDVSGSYTVFAPSNAAFTAYFSSHPKYKRVEDIPLPDLVRLVKYHIVQNPWSKIQLRSLDIRGWIDTLDTENNEPKGFKRETLVFDKDLKYGVFRDKDKRFSILDTLKTPWYRRAITDSRKFAPFFFSEYFGIYELNSSDYQFYFDRPFEGGNNIYYANAKITSDEIFAENGFVYIIDKVVEPLKNGYQILSEGNATNKYQEFLKLINLFPNFQYNSQKTFDQPGADQGLKVDSLFDLTFPELEFNLTSEKTKPPKGTYGLPQNVSIRYHHGLMAPTDQAFNQFVNQYIKIPNGWGTLDGAPIFIKRIITNTYLSTNPIYPTDFKKGFYNGEADMVRLNESNVVQKQYGSNCTFIGLNQAVVPRAFKSITGPIYLQQGYLKIMYAIENAGLLPALKRENKNYMFFVEGDGNTSQDSSLIYEQLTNRFSVFLLMPGNFTRFELTQNDLRTLLLNHVATSQPKRIARKEFIPNMAGNYIIFNNITGEVSGTAPSTRGYNGSTQVKVFSNKISTNADNGATYEINNWFNFASPTIFAKISSSYPKYHALIQKAGLSLDKEFRYSFISNNEFYTVFIPTDEALTEANVNAMTVEQLRKFILLHFVQGDLVFTDGNKPSGFYETARIDEKSTPFSTVYTNIFLETGIDAINITGKNSGVYTVIPESDKSNILTGIFLGTGQEIYPNSFNNGVIHQIDKALNVDNIKTN